MKSEDFKVKGYNILIPFPQFGGKQSGGTVSFTFYKPGH